MLMTYEMEMELMEKLGREELFDYTEEDLYFDSLPLGNGFIIIENLEEFENEL